MKELLKEFDRIELELQEHYKQMTKELVELQREIDEAKELLNKKVGK